MEKIVSNGKFKFKAALISSNLQSLLELHNLKAPVLNLFEISSVQEARCLARIFGFFSKQRNVGNANARYYTTVLSSSRVFWAALFSLAKISTILF